MYKYNKKYFEVIDTEEKAYWLGFIAADGNVRKDFLKMRIELNIKDKNHLEKFKKSLDANVPIKEYIRPNNHSCYLDINCKQLCLNLNELGITPNKSLTLEVRWEKIPEKLIKYFIRGYFDGDGSLNLYESRGYDEWELSFIGSEKTLNYFIDFFGIRKNLYSCGNNFRYCYKSKKDIKKVLETFYNDDKIYLDRKYDKVQQFMRPQRLPSDNLNG